MKFNITSLFSAKKFEMEVAKASMETCEQLIAEMGAELHDDLIQKLSIFQLYMDQLERAAKHPEHVEMILINMRTDFKQVVNSIRRISRQLLPIAEDGRSFKESIELLCQNM